MIYRKLTFLLLLSSVGFAQEYQVSAAFEKILADHNLNGSILFLRASDATYFSNDFKWSQQGFIPASTFKIANSIQALENGIVEDENTLFPWDGEERYLKSWEEDLTFRQAFQRSCVPCYQEIARKTGVELMKNSLKRIGYPEMVFDTTSIDNFWLEGDSKISQMEQIIFLKKLNEESLPLKRHTYQVMKRIMFIDYTPEYRLFGKTGWAILDGKNIGWFVGYFTTKDDVYYFATNVQPKYGFDMSEFPRIRSIVTKEAFSSLL